LPQVKPAANPRFVKFGVALYRSVTRRRTQSNVARFTMPGNNAFPGCSTGCVAIYTRSDVDLTGTSRPKPFSKSETRASARVFLRPSHLQALGYDPPPCLGDCNNSFNPVPKVGGDSFHFVLKGDVRNQVNTVASETNPGVNAFAYVNKNIFGGAGTSSVSVSLDSNGNTMVTYTGSHPVLPTYGFNYGAGFGEPHFGVEGTQGTPLVVLSQFWSFGEGQTQLLPNLSITCPAASGGNLVYAVFFTDVGFPLRSTSSTTGASDSGQWTECAFPIGTTPDFVLTNTTLFDEQLSDVGLLLSDTPIPLDDLNIGMSPPPGEPGSAFIDLAQFDGLILAPGASVEATIPEPSTLVVLFVGLFGLVVGRWGHCQLNLW
jgi:hypothetical protein